MTIEIGANLSLTPSAVPVITSVFFADSLHFLRPFIHLVATPIRRTCHYIRLFRYSTHPLRTSGRLVCHRTYLARHHLYVDFRA